MMITMWRIFVIPEGADWCGADGWAPTPPLCAELSPAATATNAATATKAANRAHLI
jgi:hypothetical protein